MSKSPTGTKAGKAIPAGGLAEMRRPPTHPGEIFRADFREALEPPINQAEAARRLGWSVNRLSEFELGKRGVTPDNAVALEALTGASAEFWLGLQMKHDLWHAYQKAGPIKAPADRALTGWRHGG